MSYTEIYKFGVDGKAVHFGETQNAFRGAMAIWMAMEKKYLSPYPKPHWMGFDDYEENGYSRTSMSMGGFDGNHPMQEIWDLATAKRVTHNDKIVLKSTFDNVIVLREDIEALLEAFDDFETGTSLKEQAELIRAELEADEDFTAIAWNQTSVNADAWTIYGENDEWLPYNIIDGRNHWDLFDDFK